MTAPAGSPPAVPGPPIGFLAPPVGGQTWLVIVLLGLSGQIAWVVENSWFNTFVYDRITPDPTPIATMVAVSAVVATVTTLIMGRWSDRLGVRKPFILLGYVLWAAATAAFPMAAWADTVSAAVFAVIVLDAVMTFVGSTANDAAFNAWVTDVTAPGNRGRVEAVLNVMPVLATMVGMGLSGVLIERFGYETFFLALGGLVLVMGLSGSLMLRESPALRPAVTRGFWRGALAVLTPSAVRRNRDLFLVFATMAIFGTGVQVAMPYEVIYLNNHLGITKSAAGLITAVVAPVLILFALPIGRLTDAGHGFRVAFVGYIVAALGAVAFSTTGNIVLLTVFGALKSVGFLMAIVLGAWHRDLVPDDARGAFQGVRLFFNVMVPMVVGPALGSLIIRYLGVPTVLNGQPGFIPPPAIYVVSGIVVALSVIPLVILYRRRGGRSA